MKRKVLIVGPLGDFGGRELETGFIAETLIEAYEVKILSTGNLTSKSQIFDFVSKNKVVTLNQKISKNSLWFRILKCFSYINSNKKQPLINYTSNNLAKKTGYRKFAIQQILEEVDDSDVVILCAQISSNYVEEIVNYANSKKVLVVLRTSMTIKKHQLVDKNWLHKIDLYIHHSQANAAQLSGLKSHHFTIIDQCTYMEAEMLKIKPTEKFSSLLYIGRLSAEKGIKELVTWFKKHGIKLKLNIVGDGDLYSEIKEMSKDLDSLNVLGHLNQKDILQHIKASDAIIIPSLEESGPLVGLEAMASARIILSTKVGAMPERLQGATNQFWFQINDDDSLLRCIGAIEMLDSHQLREIALENRAVYLKNYREKEIRSQYKNAIFKLIN